MPRYKEKDARIVTLYLRKKFLEALDEERGDFSRGEFLEQIFFAYGREKIELVKENMDLKKKIARLEKKLQMLHNREFKNFKRKVLDWWSMLDVASKRNIEQFPLWRTYREQYLELRKNTPDDELDKIFKVEQS